MHGRVETFSRPTEAADAAAAQFARLAAEAAAQRGRFVVALAGGTALSEVYRRLAAPGVSEMVPWQAVHLFTTDERLGDPGAAERHVRAGFVARVPLPPEQWHQVSEIGPADQVAQSYAESISAVLGADCFDLVLLDMGADGHVAAVYPGSEALYDERPGVVGHWAPGLDGWCVTLTLAEINRARNVTVLAVGSEKAAAVADLRTGVSGVPAARLRPSNGQLTWLVDRAAGAVGGHEDWKRAAAEAAVAELRSGMAVGLGTGSTVRWVLEALARELREGRLTGIVGVPTSADTQRRAIALGIPLATLEETPALDVALDGADEIDPQLNLVKGGGGALLREKIVAHAARELVIVADSAKQVPRLLDAFPLPVEVVPFGWSTHRTGLAALGGDVTLRRDGDDPFLTDSGHYILDCRFPGGVDDLAALEVAIRALPGVVATGLFLGVATRAFVAGANGVQTVERS